MTFREHNKEMLELGLPVSHTANLRVFIQVGLGFFFILLGQLMSVKLRNVRVSPNIKAKTYPEVFGRSDYMVFNNRSRAITKRLQSA
eukprot:gene36900-44767_t